MTARAIAVAALEAGQTQSLIGEDFKATKILLEALGLIAKHGNLIPPVNNVARRKKGKAK